MSNSIAKVKKEVEELERSLTQLVKEYDLFFRGYEKVEPINKRKALKRNLNKLLISRVNNLIIKQKVANLSQRFATYQRKWDQIWIQIERGTYKIDRYKMKLRQKFSAKEENTTEDKNSSQKSKSRPQDDNYKSILDKYVTTQKLLGVNKSFDYAKLSKKLKQQEEKIKNKYKCKGVNFKVTVKDGKATIKPILIK